MVDLSDVYSPRTAEALHRLAELMREEKAEPVAEPDPATSVLPTYLHLIPDFLRAIDDIGRYGAEKYGADSFQSRRAQGDRSRGQLNRCSTSEIGEHVREHYRQYMAGIPHDHFQSRRHQLAAAAFNCMMEFYFAGLEDEEAGK